MGIVYEVCAEGSWKEVSCAEYEHFKGRKRIRPKGINPMFYTITNMLLAYR